MNLIIMLYYHQQQWQQYQIKRKFEWNVIVLHYGDKHTQQQQYLIAPGIDKYDRIGPTGIRFCKFDNIGCMFNGT